ncbi:hypothetical protein ACFLXD_07030, partial [Chloroflexota bacterium]
GAIKFTNRLELTREEIVSSYKYGDISEYPEHEALNGITGIEQWKIIRQLTSELEQKVFKVRLMWEDGGKTKWKKIKQKDGGWITL